MVVGDDAYVCTEMVLAGTVVLSIIAAGVVITSLSKDRENVLKTRNFNLKIFENL
jgi:hypothetical protein